MGQVALPLSPAESGGGGLPVHCLGGPVSLSGHQLHVSNRMGCRLGCIPSKSLSRSKISLHLFLFIRRRIKCKYSHEEQSPCLSLGSLAFSY